MVLKVAVASLFVFASACTVGEVSGSGTPPADAPMTPIDTPSGTPDTPSADPEAVFNTDVKPLITAKGCAASSSCHGTGTAQPPDLGTYAALLTSNSGKYVKNPGTSNVLTTKAGPTTPHQGVTFTADEQAKIAAWIEIAGPN